MALPSAAKNQKHGFSRFGGHRSLRAGQVIYRSMQNLILLIIDLEYFSRFGRRSGAINRKLLKIQLATSGHRSHISGQFWCRKKELIEFFLSTPNLSFRSDRVADRNFLNFGVFSGFWPMATKRKYRRPKE